jgi:hypothetical protein
MTNNIPDIVGGEMGPITVILESLRLEITWVPSQSTTGILPATVHRGYVATHIYLAIKVRILIPV